MKQQLLGFLVPLVPRVQAFKTAWTPTPSDRGRKRRPSVYGDCWPHSPIIFYLPIEIIISPSSARIPDFVLSAFGSILLWLSTWLIPTVTLKLCHLLFHCLGDLLPGWLPFSLFYCSILSVSFERVIFFLLLISKYIALYHAILGSCIYHLPGTLNCIYMG